MSTNRLALIASCLIVWVGESGRFRYMQSTWSDKSHVATVRSGASWNICFKFHGSCSAAQLKSLFKPPNLVHIDFLFANQIGAEWKAEPFIRYYLIPFFLSAITVCLQPAWTERRKWSADTQVHPESLAQPTSTEKMVKILINARFSFYTWTTVSKYFSMLNT